MTEEQALKLFKGLADRSRLQILKSLLEEDMYVERLGPAAGAHPRHGVFPFKKADGRRGGLLPPGAVLHHVLYQ